MTKLEQKARIVVRKSMSLCMDNMEEEDIYIDDLTRLYIAGYTEALRWRDVIRDKHGFATCECLNEILNHEQVLFLMNDGVIDAMSKNHDKTGWRGEIERNIDYVKYRPIETI